MTFNIVQIIFLIVLTATISFIKSQNEIPTLTSFNITKKLKKYDLALIEFTTSSCNLCSYLEKTMYDLLSYTNKIFLDYKKTIYIAKINVENDPALPEKYSVYKFPSLLLLNNVYQTVRVYPIESLEMNIPKLLSFIDS